MILVFSATRNSNKSFINRIYGGFLGQLIPLILVPSCFFVMSADGYFILILSMTAFMALSTAFLDSSVIALTSCFPLDCQEALQLGVGLSTLIGCIFRIFTKLSFSQNDSGTIVSSVVYFYIGAFTILICVLSFAFLMRSEFAKKVLNIKEDSETRQNMPSPFTKSTSFGTLDDNLSDRISDSKSSNVLGDVGNEDDIYIDVGLERDPLLLNDEAFLSVSQKKELFYSTLKNALSITFLFLTTLSVWPALIAELKSSYFPELMESGWWSLILLFIFALFDVIGRFMVPRRFGVTKDNIWIPVVLRLLFIPILIVSVKGWYFTNDILIILFVIILGWTNGWCGSLTIILMSECVDTDKEKRFVGTLTSFSLNFGLVLGSILGLLVESFILNKAL